MEGGTIDVNIKTGSPLSKTAVVLIYATYSTDLVIDSEDNVLKYLF